MRHSTQPITGHAKIAVSRTSKLHPVTNPQATSRAGTRHPQLRPASRASSAASAARVARSRARPIRVVAVRSVYPRVRLTKTNGVPRAKAAASAPVDRET